MQSIKDMNYCDAVVVANLFDAFRLYLPITAGITLPGRANSLKTTPSYANLFSIIRQQLLMTRQQRKLSPIFK